MCKMDGGFAPSEDSAFTSMRHTASTRDLRQRRGEVQLPTFARATKVGSVGSTASVSAAAAAYASPPSSAASDAAGENESFGLSFARSTSSSVQTRSSRAKPASPPVSLSASPVPPPASPVQSSSDGLISTLTAVWGVVQCVLDFLYEYLLPAVILLCLAIKALQKAGVDIDELLDDVGLEELGDMLD